MLKLLRICEEITLEELSHYEKFLSENRLEKIANISNKTQKVRSFLTELFVKYNIHAQTEIPLDEIQFYFGEFGKPYLSGFTDYYFSVSHSGNAVVFASDKTEIGVDIEENLPRIKKLPTKFLTENEVSHIENSTDKTLSFYKIWTGKEAFVKYTGDGFHRSFKSFDVIESEISDRLFTTIYDSYTISVCSENEACNCEIETISTEEVLRFFSAK